MKSFINSLTGLVIGLLLTGSLAAQEVKLSRDYWNPNRSKRAVFVQFSDSVDAKTALAKLEELNLHPADINDLMAQLVSTYSAPSAKIVALGSRWDGVTGYDYIPFSDVKERKYVSLRYHEYLWDTSYLFMAFRQFDDPLSFLTLEYNFKWKVKMDDEDVSENLFVNNEHRVMLLQEYHAPIVESAETYMGETVLWHATVRGQIIDIPRILSYQCILNPKEINGNIVFKAVDRGGKNGFYIVVPVSGDVYYVNK